MTRPAWQIFTGEYPPEPGGVADYTAQIAAGLAATGREVHVWTSQGGGESTAVPGVIVHRLDGWSPADLTGLGEALDTFPTPRRLLVQYTPNAWGYKGLNLGFCRWLVARRKEYGDEVQLMFHEVAYPWLIRDRPTRWLLAAGHRWMARTLLKAGGPVDVATPAWESLLRRYGAGARREIGWRPVPSNIPVIVDSEAVATIRQKVAPRGESIVGSFSSFAALTGPRLAEVLSNVLQDRPDRVALLIGQGSDRFAADLIATTPGVSGRVIATGSLPAAEISTHLQACDLMVQPYPDGITTRRTSLMASLAHGVATVSNRGRSTESFWAEAGALGLASCVETVMAEVERLLADPAERARIGDAGHALYQRRFALERTIEAMEAREAL